MPRCASTAHGVYLASGVVTVDSMFGLLELLDRFDAGALDATTNLRWAPISGVFIVASAWWFKGLIFVGVGALGDLKNRSVLPLAALVGALAFGITSGIVAATKEAVGRLRPAITDPTFETLVATPSSGSFPSGHAATAFAAAVAVGVIYPRVRWPLVCIAGLVALSRVYLGVHYWLDILVGCALGSAIGLGVAWGAERVVRGSAASPAPT